MHNSPFNLADLRVSPTAALFEGEPRAGVDISMFVTRTPPGRARSTCTSTRTPKRSCSLRDTAGGRAEAR